MILKKKYFIFLAVLLVAMMSVAVAADVNDSTDESITPAVTHTTDNVDTQTATQASNEITKKINETSIKESVQNTPKTVIVDSTNYSTVFLNDSLSSTINDGDTIDVQGDIINTDLNITINKAINLTTTTGATIYLNTTGGNLLGTNPGNSFKIVNSGSYTNVTNLKFYNTQVFVINAHHVTMDNINVTVENRTVGSGVGVTSIRDNSTYVTVKNSNFYTKNNGGSSSVVLAWADYCTIDNNNITGEGNVGNLMYLTTYNINGTPEYAVDINMYNNITNNNITAVSVTGPCVGVVVTGHDNKFENNKVNVSSSFAGQWMSPTMNEQGDHDDRWEGNSYINNKVYGSFTGTKNSTITDNKFNKTVSLPERCIFKNNNAENFTVTIKGSNCDLCGNRIYHLTVNSGVTNTRVCRDNVFINGYDGSFTWYTHPTSLGLLNKKSIQQVKTEGEPTVITITEENYAEWFKLDDAKRLKFVSGSNGAKTFYIEYLPTNITMLDLYTWYSTSWDTSQYTFIGKNNFNLTNVKLRAWGANVLISNMTLYYDEDYENSGDSFSYYIFIESDYDFVPGSSFVLDNIKINYTGKYLENYHAGVLCTGENQPGVTYQNFEINAKMLSVPDGNELIILERNDKFINSTVNIVENYATADETSITGIKVNSKSVTIKDNNITLTGESTLTAIKLNSNNNTITNNNITVTTTGTANGVELTGNDNTVTDNTIIANDLAGDAAVIATGENNVVSGNSPNIVDIVDDASVSNYFNTFEDEGILYMSLKNNVVTTDTVFNLYYVPTGVGVIQLNNIRNQDVSVSLVGQNNLTLNNIFVQISHPKFYLSNINFKYDESFGFSYALSLGNRLARDDNCVVADNITVDYTADYNTGRLALLNLVQIADNSKSNITIKNSVINAFIPSTSDSDDLSRLVEIRTSNVKFINNVINIEESYTVGETPKLFAFYETRNGIGNWTFDYNNITITGEGDCHGITSSGNGHIITNNQIIVTSESTATAVELNGNDNTVTDNYIIANDLAGDAAVIATGENNVVRDNLPAPSVNTLNDANWTEYFNDDGTVKAFIVAGSELRFEGEFNNRNMIISKALNLTSADTQAVLNNCTFFIDADNVNVTNIQMNADDMESSLIYVEDAEDTRIENNTLTLTNNGEKLVTHTINVIESSNVIIRNNTITTTGPEEDVVYDGFQTTLIYTTSINSELTDSITIDNNNIKTKGNGKSTETGTIYGVYVSGEYIYDDEYYVNDIAITNNNITTEADAYAYSIDLGHADVALVENNTLTSTGKKYAGGIQGYNVNNTVITTNILKITSDNLGYGINVNGFFYMDDDWNMDTLVVEENIISNNEINITANDAWAVEIVIGDDNTVEYNNITIEASNGVGVGIADCNATIIENNNINIAATQENAMNTGDSIDSYTTGVKITACKVGIKTPHKNNVTSNNITINAVNNDVAAVNLTSNNNTITDNYLLSPAGRGDKAVADTGEDNTIENNIPDYRLTDDTYTFYFDENGILNEEYNNTEIPIYGDFTENTQFIFEGVNVTIKADDLATLHDSQIITGNGATVVLDGITIMNKDMDAIYFESNANVIKNSIIFVNSSMPLHLIEFAGDENTITNSIITAYIPSADVAYDKDYVGLPQSSALYISSNNNTVENVGVIVNGAEVAEGSYYPSIDAIDIQSTGKGVVIEGNTLRNVTVIATGSNYVYGINVGRAKDTTIENVDIDVDSDYYTNGIQLFDAVDITIDGTIDSTADTQAYGVYATAMAVGTSSGIDLTGLNITVEAPDATGVLIEGASDVIIADATYDINGGSTTAVNAHVDWMGNIPENIIITGMDINIDGTEDNSILYFGLCDGVTITDCNIETTSGSEINFNKTSDAQVINNYILIKDMMTGSFGNYAVITTEDDTTVENNTPTSKLIDELNQQIEDLQNELDQLKAPKATTLTLDPVTDAKYNTNITITGTLVNEDSIGLFNQVVTLTIGDKTVDVTTKGGVFEYTTSFKTLEEQTVTATYAGTDKYNASEDTITFTLEKGDVIVTVDEIAETAYGDNVTITGKFTTSDGKAISNSNVKITIDGKKYYAKTDKTGTYTLSVKASTVGENTITAGYSGNTNYNAYETTATFNVKAADAVVTYEPISDVTLGENVTITGTFTDANGKAVTNSNVKITINGKKYYAKTDSTGKYTLSVTTTKEGINNVTIGYSGSAKYNAFETSTTFTVLKKA